MHRAGYAIRMVDWTMEPTVRFQLPERRLAQDLLELLDSLSSEPQKHPIIQWLDLFRNPGAAFRRAFVPIRRRAQMRPPYNRQSDISCAREAVENLIGSFQEYLNEFELGLVMRMSTFKEPLSFRLSCHDEKISRQFRLLAALLAVLQNGDIRLVRRCVVCSRWMHAHQYNQRYHDKHCRQNAWQSIPDVKKHRNEDRRRRYRDERERDRRALEIARHRESRVGSKQSSKD